ncbi:SDR family oxidoreductase [Salinicoccus sp. ID82-1]|uniref:SDR family NAD(P)-dependent oxidoreductase n=1 Tax=Salinicoccus sp. ID82-1 TaxID=2820269 RepID=UPI001F3F26E5|nr:SDR family oxidoreductase [Salinicoccus sp. ID82-1]MCG1008745.1 SDR family oxidoreductase [Salinicoccus sp. ID82-1]
MTRHIIVGSTGDIGSAIHAGLEGNAEIWSFSRSQTPDYDSIHHFLDLSEPLDASAVENIFKDIDHVDSLIWCPGETLFEMLEDTPLEKVDAQYNISLRSLITFIKVLLPKLRKSGCGRIIIITSIWGRHGASFESVYAAMKGAQEALIKSLAKELAGTTITVNGIAPGVVEGKMTSELSQEDQAFLIQELPQSRFVAREEVMHAVAYLLSPGARSVTGEIMNINGGWYT